ncbi:MAG: hypothetical protein ABJL99_18815 [Aliishimia sp.]
MIQSSRSSAMKDLSCTTAVSPICSGLMMKGLALASADITAFWLIGPFSTA